MKKMIPILKGQKLGIQCTWANAFINPVWNRAECIRSFDHDLLSDLDVENTIGFATGNIATDQKGSTWIEAELLYTDRMAIGWFRENDVAFESKGTNYKGSDGSKLKWLAAGLAILQFLR